MYSISLVRVYMECPTDMNLLAAKRILCYLKGTKDSELSSLKKKNQIWFSLLIVIMQDIKMIDRLLRVMCLCQGQGLCRCPIKNKQLSRHQVHKFNS